MELTQTKQATESLFQACLIAETPVVDLNDAYCEKECVACSEACPTGAINPISIDDKSAYPIALATFELEKCLLYFDRECSICRRECPYEAISFIWLDDAYANIPAIDPDVCVGCGRCVVYCPGEPSFDESDEAIEEEPQTEQGSPDGRSDVYGMYLSLELENGNVEEFQLALEQSPYSGQFYVYDQGYEAVQKDVNGLTVSVKRLLWIAIGGWVLLLIRYLLMYQSSQKKNVGIMRSLGAQPAKAAAYLAVSGILVAVVGVAVGTILSRVALEAVQERVLSDMLGMIDRTAAGGALVISDEMLTEMVQNSIPPMSTTALIALSELGVMSAAILIHAAILSHMPPRTLSEG